MEFSITELTEMLEISDENLAEIKNRIISYFGDEESMRAMLEQHELEQKETHCYGCDEEGDCFILHGIIRIELGDVKGAIREIEEANLHLRSKDETWNSICGLVLLGKAHEMHQQNPLALLDYQRAYYILKNYYLPLHMDDYIEKALDLETKLKNTIKNMR